MSSLNRNAVESLIKRRRIVRYEEFLLNKFSAAFVIQLRIKNIFRLKKTGVYKQWFYETRRNVIINRKKI